MTKEKFRALERNAARCAACIALAAALALPMLPRTEAAASPSGDGVLVAYFSLSGSVPEGADAVTHATPSIGSTEAAAREIAARTGGTLFAIRTERAYPERHDECSEIAEQEMRDDARPALASHVEGMENYGTVFLGYPIWWYAEPMAVRTFLEEYDFSGKTVVPFCTSLGAGVGRSVENIRELCPDSTVLRGVTLRTGSADFREPVEEWLKELGIIQ